MPQFMLEVNGVERQVALPSLSVQHQINSADILEADIQDDDGSISLETDQMVRLTQIDVSPQTVYFEGLLQTKGNETWAGWGFSRLRKITAFDYSVYTTFVDAAATTDGSLSLEAILQALVDDYLTDYGVTLHPSQATGPTIPPNVFDGVKAQVILNALSEQTGWVWKVDADKQLRMWDPATESAPFNVTATNETYVHDIQTSTQAQKKYNRVFVEGGNGYHTITGEQHFGDGAATEFPLNAPMHYFEVDYTSTLGFMVGLTVLVHRTGGTTVEYANDQNTAQWRVANYGGTTEVFRNNPSLVQVSGAVLGPTEYIEIPAYAAQYPFRMVADGRGSPPDPARDLTLVRPLIFNREALQAIADETLAAMSGDHEQATYPTTRTDIRPGQSQTINVPEAGVNGTYTCTDARLRYEPGGDTGEFWIEVRSVNEVTARSFWLNLLDRWLTDNQGTSSAGIGAVGTAIPQGPAAPFLSVQFNDSGKFGGNPAVTVSEAKTSLRVGKELAIVGDYNQVIGENHVVGT